jgi:hypothetical protein
MFEDGRGERFTIAMILAFVIFGIILFGCKKSPDIVGTPSRIFSDREWKPRATHHWKSEFAEWVEQDIRTYAPHLIDYKLTCPNSKVQVLVGDLFRAMMWAESSYNPKTKYLESSNIYSIGLMQMSYSDGPNYKFTIKNLEDPRENIQVAVRVLGSLTKGLDESDPCSFYRAGGRYWSTLRTPACWNPARLQSWARTVEELGKCQ